nr:C40 family peptidase [Amylibacter sp.]
MTDRRLWRANGRVAHSSLQGQLQGVTFTDGTPLRICVPVADVLAAPDGALDRQLIYGDGFTVLEFRDGFAFGFETCSGYVGTVLATELADLPEPTHRVTSFGAHLYPERSIKTVPVMTLPFDGMLACFDLRDGFWRTAHGYVPAQQVAPVTAVDPDTAQTALRFLGVPYLWGGDSNQGIDCSGLIHAALRAAGRECPRDSDQQAAFFEEIPEGSALQRGDLVFWAGHVAMMLDAETIVHANGYHMMVTVEKLDAVAARIQAAEGKEISKRARV